MSEYESGNIFAKILRGEIPCHKVFEDGDTLVFLDVMPQADGHVLVVPKRPSRNLLDADPAIFTPLMTTVQKVARAVKTAFATDGILIQQFNEAASGQTVFHLHVHVIPRRMGEALRPHTGKMAAPALLAAQAEKIQKALAEA
jgi:histidine triad (HIT) family protein